MKEFSSTIVALSIGTLLGFVGTIIIEWIRRVWKKKDQRNEAHKLLQFLSKEIEEGIKRCNRLIDEAARNRISFSRIYIGFWNSAILTILKTIDDLEVLRLLHQIYYRFDLINFNMEREAFGSGAAFAKTHIAEIKANYTLLKGKIDS